MNKVKHAHSNWHKYSYAKLCVFAVISICVKDNVSTKLFINCKIVGEYLSGDTWGIPSALSVYRNSF